MVVIWEVWPKEEAKRPHTRHSPGIFSVAMPARW